MVTLLKSVSLSDTKNYLKWVKEKMRNEKINAGSTDNAFEGFHSKQGQRKGMLFRRSDRFKKGFLRWRG